MKRSAAKGLRSPIVLKSGGCSVSIYQTVNRIYRRDPARNARVLASEHPQFTLCYYLGSKRVRRKFTSEREARNEAQLVLNKLSNGETEVLKLTGSDRAEYVHAVARLENCRPTVSLLSAVDQYAELVQRLGERATLREAVDYWIKRHPSHLTFKPLNMVIEEFVAAKQDAGKSKVYLKDLRCRLGHFAKSVNLPISEITGRHIEDFLRGLKVGPRTQNNHRRIIGTLFQFAIKRGYLPKDYAELEAVEKMVVPSKDVEIFTPEDLRRLFRAASPEMQPYLAISAFAGVRAAEIERLDWSDINLPERRITVKAGKAKTASRRTIPIPDNLALWLAPHAKPFGPVAPYLNMSNQLTHRLSVGAGVPWKHNALRHSFVSYRIALLKNVHEVSLEAGNSPQMIHQHYRELVTEAAAKEWFAISPDQSPNILAMPLRPAASH